MVPVAQGLDAEEDNLQRRSKPAVNVKATSRDLTFMTILEVEGLLDCYGGC